MDWDRREGHKRQELRKGMLGNEFPGCIKQIGMERIQGVRRERETWREKQGRMSKKR